MPAFSVEIHNYLRGKILLMKKEKKVAILENNRRKQLYSEGQLLELMVMREYLGENIDLKTQTYF